MRIRPPQNPKSNDSNEPKKSHKAHSNHEKKSFKLPKKETSGDQQVASQRQMQSIEQGAVEQQAKSGPVKGTPPLAHVNQLIVSLVDSMQVGKIGETEVLQMDLKGDAKVDTALQGASLRLEMENGNLKVFIEPLPDQKGAAEALLASQKDQVQKLQEALSLKNIELQHLQIGDHTAHLGHEKPLTPSELFSSEQSGSRGREGRREGPPERIDPTEKS